MPHGTGPSVLRFGSADETWTVALVPVEEGWAVRDAGRPELATGQRFGSRAEAVAAMVTSTTDPLRDVDAPGADLVDAARVLEAYLDESRAADLRINGVLMQWWDWDAGVLLPADLETGTELLREWDAHEEGEAEAPELSMDSYEQIRRFGDLFFVVNGGDPVSEPAVVGRFAEEDDGLRAAAALSGHFFVESDGEVMTEDEEQDRFAEDELDGQL